MEEEMVREESDSTVCEEDSVVQQASPVKIPPGKKVKEKRTVIEEKTWIGEEDSDQQVVKANAPRSTLFQIGWRECVLAMLVTAVGAVGYVCHVTDYCNFC